MLVHVLLSTEHAMRRHILCIVVCFEIRKLLPKRKCVRILLRLLVLVWLRAHLTLFALEFKLDILALSALVVDSVAIRCSRDFVKDIVEMLHVEMLLFLLEKLPLVRALQAAFRAKVKA